MKHTPEPWSFSDGLGHYEGSVVITSKTMTERTPLAVISDICGDANIDARRIVACVNACRDFEIEELEGYCEERSVTLKFVIDYQCFAIGEVEHEKSELKAQRDELLAALKGLRQLVDDNYHVDDAGMPAYNAAYDAIAKCEAQS